MTSFGEKIIMTAVSVVCIVLAAVLADDEVVRSALLMLSGAPVGGAFYPRKAERELRAIERHSRPH